MRKFLLTCCLLLAPALSVAASQDHALVRQAVSTFVQQQTAAMSGKVDFSIDPIDPRIALAECPKLIAFLPSGSQLLGRTMIGVRCASKGGWSIFVPVRVRISQELFVSARQLPRDHQIQEGDFSRQTIELTQAAGFTDPNQIIGKVLRYSITAGQVLRADMLRQPFQVTQGQLVQLRVQGNGYAISSEGTAMNNASEGQSVKVRVGSGRVISGTARDDGTVEVKP
ncbi:MAG: flagellar basal body P-ring formation chaperone FlgA [Gallionella sp.]|nr:flagellar basal body P-ring formation chaperone FlgA [Gallionella sp.]